MSELNERVLESFRSELRKIAAPGRLHALLGSAGALGGIGAAGGALLGAGVQGTRGYLKAREQGGSVRQSLGAGVSGAAGGAAKGALIGGATGLAGGAALGAVKPDLANKVRAAVDDIPGAHFGQRQVHSLTGWTPEKGLGSIGHGAGPKIEAMRAAQRDAQKTLLTGKGERTIGDRIMGRTAEQGALKRLHGAMDAAEAAQKAEDMGLTSLPGYAKSLATRPVETIRAAVNDQWKGMSPGMKALTVGAPALELAGALKSKNEVDEQGQTKGERVGRSLANTAGGMLLSPLTMTTQMAVGGGLTALGRRAGRLIGGAPRGALAPKPPGAPDLTQDSGQATPVEREISDRASGAAPEAIGS